MNRTLYTILALVIGTSPVLFSDDTAHRVKNCEIEIEMLKNNLQSQEDSRQQLYKEMESTLASAKQVLKAAESSNNDPKQKMGKAMQDFQSDLATLKQHMNQLSTKVNELSSTLSNLKKELSGQSAGMKSIEDAIALLSKALDPQKDASPVKLSKSGKYVVQSGDSLEKIARKNDLTIKELKEMNSLSSSVIRVGQELNVRRSE